MVFDSLISRHSGITYEITNVERIYIKQALSLLPSHVLTKFISEGWKITVYSDVQELMEINSNISALTVGLTEYELRKVFIQKRATEIDFKYTLVHEIVHTYDCIIDGNNCNWKSEKYYNSEIENIMVQEGHLFSDHANSSVIEYLGAVISRFIFNMTDFTQAPLTKAFIDKYFFMVENSIEQRLKNLENNAVTYIELDETYNRLKYSKLNKENDKYTIQLPETSSGSGSNSSGDSKIIYDNNVTFSTSVSYFSVNKTTISYIKNVQLTDDISGTWELKTIMGSNMGTSIQYRTFILDSSNSYISEITSYKFKDLPHIQRRFYDYNESRTWTEWEDVITDIKNPTIVTKTIGSNSILNLSSDKYQKCIMVDLTQIQLPTVSSFTEIHLFFSTTEALTLVFPSCKWQSEPTIEANKYYEFIFTYVGEWLGGCIVYE